MTTNFEINFDNIERKPLHHFTEQAYLEYSMYVILDRALPHISDGLKPVQRRIIYAMSELGLSAGAKYKKSARTVGDVIGKFHPHGDMACYEAMVLMAQPFAYRYPLVDGQGNWGSMDDPKSFAAMRYTESKLTRYAEVLLSELEQGTVDWVPNFDGTLEEPRQFPARLPNLLLNGTSGIAVGMATDIPPHNLREVAAACIRLLEEPSATLEQLCEHIKGPDFPTAAEIITAPADILKIYQTGNGSVKMRAVYEEENGNVIITALPYQSSGSKIMEQIAAQMQAKKLPMLEDLRDESDHETPTRLVLVPRSNKVDVQQMMTHLFATTDLEKSFRVNMNVIGINYLPEVKDLRALLQEWLSFRTTTVTRRLQYRLDKVIARLHILEGLLIAFLNIDEVIAIIRFEDEPKLALMARFQLSDAQAEAILELKLRHIAKLEEMKIRGEQNELAAERDHLQEILADKDKLRNLIRDEIHQDAERYGDARRSPIVQRSEARAIQETELITNEPVTVILSEKGWVRSAKGHDINATELNYRAGDQFKAAIKGRTSQQAVFLDSSGRCYTLNIHQLPSARGLGEPLSGRFTPPDGVTFQGVMVGEPGSQFLLATDSGYGFVAEFEQLCTKNKAGKAVVTVPEGSRVLAPYPIADYSNDLLAVATNEGYLLLFPVGELPLLPRGKGLKLINIPTSKLAKREEYVTATITLNRNEHLIIQAGQRHLTLKPDDFPNYLAERGRRGSKLPRGFQQVMSMKSVMT